MSTPAASVLEQACEHCQLGLHVRLYLNVKELEKAKSRMCFDKTVHEVEIQDKSISLDMSVEVLCGISMFPSLTCMSRLDIQTLNCTCVSRSVNAVCVLCPVCHGISSTLRH